MGFGDLFSGIVGGIQGLFNIGRGIAGDVLNEQDRSWRRDMQYRNFELQKQQFEYEKSLQQQIFNREDSAVQRRMADLKAAGLSPLLAAAGQGSNAGTPIATQAPQMDTETGTARDWGSNISTAMADSLAVVNGIAQAQKTKEERLGIKLDNRLKEQEYVNAVNFNSHLLEAQLGIKLQELDSLKNHNSQNGLRKEQLEESIKQTRASIDKINNDIKAVTAGINLTNAKIKAQKYDNLVRRDDIRFYDNLYRKMGFQLPIDNWKPLEAVGGAADAVFDNIMDIASMGAFSGLKGALKGIIPKSGGSK